MYDGGYIKKEKEVFVQISTEKERRLVPGILLALFEKEAGELESLLTRIDIPLSAFFKSKNCREILRQRFRYISSDFGCAWLNQVYLLSFKKRGDRNE